MEIWYVFVVSVVKLMESQKYVHCCLMENVRNYEADWEKNSYAHSRIKKGYGNCVLQCGRFFAVDGIELVPPKQFEAQRVEMRKLRTRLQLDARLTELYTQNCCCHLSCIARNII